MPKQYSDKQKLAYYKKKAAAKPARKRYVKGQGAYKIPRDFFNAQKLGAGLGGAGGSLIGNMIAPGIGGSIGAGLGEMAGSGLGSLFRKITGWGDYAVKSNSLINKDEIVPTFGEDSIRVRKREFISALNATSTGFANEAFAIQPGLDTSFPWLSAIAANYEQYRINGMIFQFVSTSSDAIASTTALGLGQVILATNYNAAEDPFVDAPQMLNYTFSNSGKPSDNILHAIECAPTDTPQKLYYVRTGDVPENQDARLYDLGTFQIATNNMPAAYTGMGQLWCSYDITFCKAQANNQLGFSVNTDRWHFTSNMTNTAEFGDGGTDGAEWIASEGSNIGCTITARSIAFPEHLFSGYYSVYVKWIGTAAAITNPSWTPVNCMATEIVNNSNKKEVAPANGVSSVTVSNYFVVKLGVTNNATQCTLTLSAGTFPTSMTQCILIISQVNGDLAGNFETEALAAF